jgi:hypothetical protein
MSPAEPLNLEQLIISRDQADTGRAPSIAGIIPDAATFDAR